MKKVLVTLVIVVIAVVVLYWANLPFKTVSVSEEQEIEVDGIQELSIQTTAADVELIPSSTNHVKVSVNGEIKRGFNHTYQLEITEDVEKQKLNISYVNDTKKLGLRLGSEVNLTLQVALPERAYKKFEIYTTSGDIQIQSIEVEEMKVNSTSGDQSIEESLTTGTLSLQASSGDISLRDNTFNHFIIKTTSGEVSHKNFRSEKGAIHTTSGDVILFLEEMIPTLSTNSTSGDVNIQFEKEPETLDFKFNSNSGKATVNLENMIFEEGSERKVGRIGRGEDRLTIQTTSGDLTVE
ncbi:DUF4097 domain-containing protein [Sporosarcina sp. ACRSL]|uniref:DUF4097 family beta strand repeat-containing protein n=1 Tax=Sporosarcina sp. ACRSL TaxID=2918215 RepID=UPI001EF47FE8|nr:DUF4097 family beta strand repeat-containing protein [Sporosarcina sp. ACRSL]MCG7344695.1 DUF4097 domain-containing protein [Sporosarcina sp. ACRSL]